MSSKPSIKNRFLSRRRLLLLAGMLPFSAVLARKRLARTPKQTSGPFYPDPPPAGADADLTRHEGATNSSRGEPLELSGRVLDEYGRPINNALVEIWQCDTAGRYHHPLDGEVSQRDPAFQGYAQQRVGEDGRYTIRCIKPVAYTGRTPHLHVAVRVGSKMALVTQLYVAGDPQNDSDFIYRRLGVSRQRLVTLDLVQAEPGWAANCDLVLAAAVG